MRCSGLSGIEIRYPGYITGRTALAFWGVSLEEDVPVEVATTVTDAERDGVLYVWVPDDMYFGFVVREGLPAPVATPEKALVDGFWIEERWGIRACDPDDILWEMLDADALAEVLVRVGPDFIRHIPAGGGVRTAERAAFLRAVRRRLSDSLPRGHRDGVPAREGD